MALYLGNSEKLKIILDGKAYKINLYSEISATNEIKLLSSDGYILKDINGLFITSKEESE